MIPDRFPVALLAREWLSENTVELRLSRPDGFEFTPGQRLRVYHESLERDYSLASGPADPELRLIIRVFSRGRVSTFLSTVEIGAPLTLSGPMGYFVFRASDRIPVFIATGTGVAPFVAMCRAGLDQFVCLHGARKEADLLYRNTLKDRAARYVACLSGGDVAEEDGFHGRVTDYLAQLAADTPYDFYLCGRQAMVRDAFEIIDDRFEGAHVYSEVFY